MQEQEIIPPLNIKEHIYNFVQFIKFSIVGALNTIISMLIYYTFLKVGLFYIAANTLAYAIGMINSYTLGKKWVFKSKNSSKTAMPKFIIVNLISLILTNSFLYLVADILKFNVVSAQLIVTPLMIIINYAGNKAWAFRG
jgi:putative flippase GtrA